MKKNIIAILHHCTNGKDLSRQHRFYPKTWVCLVLAATGSSTGTLTYTGEDCLPEVFLEIFKPVFISLSQTELLQRCFLGTTHNQNESLNAVWARCPKHKNHAARQCYVLWLPLCSTSMLVRGVDFVWNGCQFMLRTKRSKLHVSQRMCHEWRSLIYRRLKEKRNDGKEKKLYVPDR